jgi:hypothetical protein
MPGFGLLGKILIFSGVLIVISGLLFLFWDLGKLPGDIYIEKGNFRFFFPIVTGLLISAGLTIVINLILLLIRFLNK